MKAAAKNVEGKVQSAAGELTGDEKMKAEGELKQVQAAAMNVAADVKDKAENLLEDMKNAAQDAIENIKDKINWTGLKSWFMSFLG